ncbi:hypothetical protein JCM5353_004709 [Sporobolomyces roseus]
MQSRGNAMAGSSSMNLTQSSDVRRNQSSSSGVGSKQRKRTGKGKGRMMMIKVFYSLQSPRFGSVSTPSAPTPSSNAASPDFFSVLDPSLSSASTAAPQPQPQPQSESNSATSYSCIARLSAPVWVQIVGLKKSGVEGSEEKSQFGKITLKTCLSAICISRPELVIDSTKDFSVSAVDPYESSGRHQAQATTSTSSNSSDRHGQGLVEGKGMLSWTLAEKKEGTTMVCGRITGSESESRRNKRRKGDDGNTLGDDLDGEDSESGDESEETLEIWLQLSERDAFTQGQFLDCLRSYHNPIQQLQSEISEYHSSPPKLQTRESGSFSSSSNLQGRTSGPPAPGDPVKRKRPQSRQSLPLSASTTALPLAPPSALANLSSSKLATSTSAPTEDPAQNHDLLAFLSQLVTSSTSASQNSSAPSLDLSQNQNALQSLAKLCGLDLPEVPASAPVEPPIPTSTSGPAPVSSSRPPKASKSTSLATSASNSTTSTSTGANRKKREHFAAIDMTGNKGTGKNNPRDPNGCSNCKRKKSTVWREGLDSQGNQTSVCNACGTFYNKNGYHRSKGASEQASANPQSNLLCSDASNATTSTVKSGRPLTGRLTATCEADLNKRKANRKVSNGSLDASASRIFQSGIVPPLSPSKHVGPRSPSLSFGFGNTGRTAATRAPGIMSSPGRSPRARSRPNQGGPGAAATSPLRAPADAFSQDGGFDFAALFGGHASPSPKKRTVSGTSNGGSGGKGVPNYLLTASPGTALNRILNETNIGAFSSFDEPMQVDQGQHEGGAEAEDENSNSFNFFLQPGSPSREKENERPRASTVGPSSSTIDAPVTDADSFESVLSSLRRDFNNRLSSNALTAPSSPVPSSPCVQPRTSTATPGSKGKAPLASGRAPPSIFDSFTDGLVTGIVMDSNGGDSRTPLSESDSWSPPDGQHQEDKTITFDSMMNGGANQGSTTAGHNSHVENYDLSHLLIPNKFNGNSTNRRAAFIPSHLIAPSDATDFDLGSLPPSSPPQLPSETFPTPSDFDGITPGTEGGDVDDRSPVEEQGRLTIEAVAEKVATEPNEEARAMVMALLQSVGNGKESGGAAVEIPGMSGGDKITLDRDTVDKLLALISNNPTTSSATVATSSAETKPPPLAQTSASNGEASPDLSQIDFFKAFEPPSHSQQQQHSQQSEQMNGLYSDLFSDTQF